MRHFLNKTGGLLALACLAVALPTAAQQSVSFELGESIFNGGGSPADGSAPASPSYRITQDAVGEGIGDASLSSTSFRVDGGFVGAYAPVTEVTGLTFTGPEELSWTAARSAAGYNVYRDSLSQLSGLSYGQCAAQDVPTNNWQDDETPVSGDGYFYLVTGLNRLDEEGTKGSSSDAAERLGTACP